MRKKGVNLFEEVKWSCVDNVHTRCFKDCVQQGVIFFCLIQVDKGELVCKSCHKVSFSKDVESLCSVPATLSGTFILVVTTVHVSIGDCKQRQ